MPTLYKLINMTKEFTFDHVSAIFYKNPNHDSNFDIVHGANINDELLQMHPFKHLFGPNS